MYYFIETFENTVKNCWNMPALNDYRSEVITYGELAARIEKMHLVWKAAGLKSGDKISLRIVDCAAWREVRGTCRSQRRPTYCR
jgi:long-chain acyl-CoA synthetase